MNPSAGNPTYTAYIITSERQYNVTPALISLEFAEQTKQIASSATLNVVDADVEGKRLTELIGPRNRVKIYANAGDEKGNEEVFRGYVWTISPKETLTEAAFSIQCYDNLIYWQESEDSEFYASGRRTDVILKLLADKWGINLAYDYEYMTHAKLVLRGAIADFITADVLDTVQKHFGKKYLIRSEKDKVWIKQLGSNETIYKITKANNATEVRRYITMNGVTTQVKIIGKASDDDKTPVEATISGDTETYGTLQKIISRSEDTTLEASKWEARNIIAEEGKPKWEHDVKAVDIPWIRKGDKVDISTDTMSGRFIVESINREISNRGKTMSLTVIDA